MRHFQTFILALTGALLFVTLAGCGQRSTPPSPAQPPAKSSSQSGLTDVQVRALAVKYRDEWVAASKLEKASFFKNSQINSVKQSTTGWEVRFATKNMARKGELLIYFLHVYIKPTGELDRVEDGGELIS